MMVSLLSSNFSPEASTKPHIYNLLTAFKSRTMLSNFRHLFLLCIILQQLRLVNLLRPVESEFVFHRRDDGKLVKVQMVGAASAALGDSSSDAGKFYLRLKKNSNNLHQKLCHWSAIMFRMTLVGFTKPWFLILSGLLIHLLGRVSECLHLPRLLLKVSS